MFPSNPNPFGNQQGGGAFTPFYQVKPNDKSLSDVAANTGQDLNNLVNLNGGAKTLPPVGSYIVTHPAGIPNNVVTTFTPQYQNQVPNFGAGHTPIQYGGQSTTTANGSTPLYTHERQKAVIDLTNQLSQGILPPVIPMNVQSGLTNPTTGQPFTAQEMIAAGYTANPITKNFELKNAGTPGAPGGGGAGNSDFANTASQQAYAAAGTSFYHQKRWDPKTRKFVEIGKLIRQGRLNERTGRFSPNKGYGTPHPAAGPVAAPMPTSTATASTVLGLHLGSG
jgi:hypothetical protein